MIGGAAIKTGAVRLSPVAALIATVLPAVLAMVIAITFAAREPFFGFPPAETGSGFLLTSPGKTAGVRITAADRVAEPDILETYPAFFDFLSRQDKIRSYLGAPFVRVSADGKSATLAASPRGLARLPGTFWLQIGVGLMCFLIGAWVWRMRPSDRATQMFALASLALLLSSFASAIYTTRELALSAPLFRIFSAFNHIGSALFGAAMIALLLVYPRRMVDDRWVAVAFLVQSCWLAADLAGLLPSLQVGAFGNLAFSFVAIVVCAGVQYARAGRDPTTRTALRWFGLSFLVGAGLPIATIIIPPLLGEEPLLQQSYAFGFFPLIHLGVALAVARYRLFDLDRWSFWILFYLLGAILLLATDAVLIAGVTTSRASAFSAALVLVTLAYLPARAWLSARVLSPAPATTAADVQGLFDLALEPHPSAQRQRWTQILDRTFEPTDIAPGPDVADAGLAEDGALMHLPAIGPLPPTTLRNAGRGRRLFAPNDVRLAREITAILRNGLQNRDAFERGMREERGRIELDVHDNLGIQLLRALHCEEPTRKNAYIREAIAELRDVVGNRRELDGTLENHLAELRVEIGDAAELVGARLRWSVDVLPVAKVPPALLHTLRALLREAVSNALKHGAPSTLAVDIVIGDDNRLRLRVEDNGCGFDPRRIKPGRGLANGQARLAARSGSLTVDSRPGATIVSAEMPLEPLR